MKGVGPMKFIVGFLLMAVSAHAGILPTSRGGTGANLTPSLGGVIASISSGFSVVTPGAANQIFVSNGTATTPLFRSSWVVPSGGTVMLAAGSATAAPFIIQSGTTLTTVYKGAIESDGTHLWWTDSSGIRHRLDNTNETP